MCNDPPTQAELDTSVQMKLRTAQHVCGVYGALSEEEGELVGSGTLLKCWGETWLVTAQHVLYKKLELTPEGARKYLALAASKGEGEQPGTLDNDVYSRSEPFDIAVTSLGAGRWSSTHTPLGASALARTSKGADKARLFLHGFPGAASLVFQFGPVSRSLPYLSGPGPVPTTPWFDPKKHISIAYDPTCLANELGVPADFVNPHGLSGSTVWAINGGADVAGWRAEDARIVGIVTNWNQPRRVLIATRIEHLHRLLRRSIPRRIAARIRQGVRAVLCGEPR